MGIVNPNTFNNSSGGMERQQNTSRCIGRINSNCIGPSVGGDYEND